VIGNKEGFTSGTAALSSSIDLVQLRGQENVGFWRCLCVFLLLRARRVRGTSFLVVPGR